MSDEQLLAHVNILLVAGHETTTNLSAWLLYLMGRHADVHPALGQALERVGGVARLELDVDVRMALAEAGEQLGEKGLAGGHRGEDDDGAGERLAATAEIALETLPAIDRLARVRGETRPLGRQPDRAAIPLETSFDQRSEGRRSARGPRG